MASYLGTREFWREYEAEQDDVLDWSTYLGVDHEWFLARYRLQRQGPAYSGFAPIGSPPPGTVSMAKVFTARPLANLNHDAFLQQTRPRWRLTPDIRA